MYAYMYTHTHTHTHTHSLTGQECDYVETASIENIAGRTPTSLAQFLVDNEQAFRRLGTA